MNEKYELVRFEENGLTFDVNVSHLEDTVWLSKEQIAQLFGRDRSVVSRHIKKFIKKENYAKIARVQKMHVRSIGKLITPSSSI